MKNIREHSEYVFHDGMDLEIKGEVFDSPVKKTENNQFHTRVEIIDKGVVKERVFFIPELDQHELVATILEMKSKIHKYL